VASRIRAHVAWQQVGGEAVLVDLETGNAVGLNPTGSFVWTRLDDQPDSEIAVALAEHFDIEKDEAAGDVREFVSRMRDRGFID